jgi:Pyridoxamine 5'-phosphate oxidase
MEDHCVPTGRGLDQRTADVRAALSRHGDLWLATASPSGEPHLIAASAWWTGARIVVATTAGSRTARNLELTRLARLALGSPDDMIAIDVSLLDAIDVDKADAPAREGFAAAVGWNPADEGPNWRFFGLSPVRIQAYRGYAELHGRHVMRHGLWLADR